MARYSYELAAVNESQLHQEVALLNIPGFLGITSGPPGGPTVLVGVDFEADISAPDQQRLDATVAAHVPEGPKRKRILWDILQDYLALSGSQRSKVWADLTKGDPPLWALDAGPNAASVFSLHWAVEQGGGPTAVDVAKSYLVSAYVQDVPDYLVHPPFDESINISGEEEIPA
jgi:hypothetical protein